MSQRRSQYPSWWRWCWCCVAYSFYRLWLNLEQRTETVGGIVESSPPLRGRLPRPRPPLVQPLRHLLPHPLLSLHPRQKERNCCPTPNRRSEWHDLSGKRRGRFGKGPRADLLPHHHHRFYPPPPLLRASPHHHEALPSRYRLSLECMTPWEALEKRPRLPRRVAAAAAVGGMVAARAPSQRAQCRARHRQSRHRFCGATPLPRPPVRVCLLRYHRYGRQVMTSPRGLISCPCGECRRWLTGCRRRRCLSCCGESGSGERGLGKSGTSLKGTRNLKGRPCPRSRGSGARGKLRERCGHTGVASIVVPAKRASKRTGTGGAVG